MREVGRQQDGPAHVGVALARKRTEPGFHRVDAFDLGDETQAIGDLLNLAHGFIGRLLHRPLGDGDGERGVAGADRVGAQFLQGAIGVGGLIAGVIVEERCFFAQQRLAQQA